MNFWLMAMRSPKTKATMKKMMAIWYDDDVIHLCSSWSWSCSSLRLCSSLIGRLAGFDYVTRVDCSRAAAVVVVVVAR